MTYNIGLNVVEVDGSAAPAIVGAATSVGAFNILTRRGVPNRPARMTSFTQFVEQFGGYFSGGLGAYLVKGFFDNGGQTVYVNRVVATDPTTGAAPATAILNDSANANSLRLRSGLRGREDPGSWSNDLFVKVSATSLAAQRVRETAAATTAATDIAATIDMVAANFPSLTVRVDGETNPTVITFQSSDFVTPTAATRAELRDAINRRTTKVTASIVGNHLVLTSSGEVARLRRDWTSLQVTPANATLGFANMATQLRGTTATIAANTTFVANPDSFQVGDAVRIADASDPARTGVVKLVRVVPATGEIEWTPPLANVNAYDEFQSTLALVQFDLTIGLGGSQTENTVETWTGLSMESDLPNYAPRVLNDSLRGSRYVVAADLAPGTPRRVMAALAFTRFTPGRDGEPTPQDFIGDSATHTGFSAFDSYDVQLVCCERTTPAIVSAALSYCALRGDCMFVGSVPEGFVGVGSAAVDYGRAFQGKKVYGALYGPWIKIIDPIGSGASPLKWVPPTGHVMGVYARVETSRGIWKAPAGDEANLQGALDVEYRLSDVEHTDLVKNGSINGIRIVPGAGIVVDASRTLSTDTRWLYVNVRLLFNYVKGSLKQGLRWVRQEPNKDTLWNAVKFTSVTPFLMGLWRQGAFGTGTPEQVFRVIVDATNNPPDEVDKGNLNVEVYFYPSKPAETIVIIVGQMSSGATAAEA